VPFRAAIDALSSVLFPAPCRICAAILNEVSRIPICAKCLSGFQQVVEPMCDCCGRPFVSSAATSERPLCRLCRVGYYVFDRARSYAVYNDALSSAVVLLKYEGVRSLGDWFAARLAETVSREVAEWKPDLVVPVPLHADRLRERGYYQADLIARPLAKRLHLKFGQYLLLRSKPRPAQLILSRTERWSSVRGAYATRVGVRVDNLRILLVDDVLTTGATLDACSRALKKAGAAEVFGLTVARVVPGRLYAGSTPDVPQFVGETVLGAPASSVEGEVSIRKRTKPHEQRA
jgi:ComF family protein